MEQHEEELKHFAQSPYQKIAVYQADRLRILKTDDDAVQSTMDIDHPQKLMLPYMPPMMAWLMFRSSCRETLLLGLGGGDIARFMSHYMPASLLTVVEHDEVMIEFCRDYFNLPKTKQINIVCDDARRYLAAGSHRFDAIYVDLYHNGDQPGLEKHGAVFNHCHRRLNDNGVLVINLITEDADYFKTLLWDLRSLFDRSTLCMTVPGHKNIIIFAFNTRPTRVSRTDLIEQAKHLSPAYELDFEAMIDNLFVTNPSKEGKLLF